MGWRGRRGSSPQAEEEERTHFTPPWATLTYAHCVREREGGRGKGELVSDPGEAQQRRRFFTRESPDSESCNVGFHFPTRRRPSGRLSSFAATYCGKECLARRKKGGGGNPNVLCVSSRFIRNSVAVEGKKLHAQWNGREKEST